jgi:hypothetical protein
MKFISHRGSANLRAAFQYEWFESRLGQIKRRDQPVMPAADDDDIPPAISRLPRH